MKIQLKLFLIVLCISTLKINAQIKPQRGLKNVKISNSRAVKIDKDIPVIKKLNLRELESAKTSISNPKPINIDPNLLKISSRRKWRINAKKPYDNELSISFFGNYSINGFIVSPRLSGNTVNAYSPNEYYTYSAFIIFNAKAGKEYRLTVELKDVIKIGTIKVIDQVSTVSKYNRTIIYVFKTQSNGQHYISMSPYKIDGAVNPSDFTISSIQIDQISD